MRRQRKANDAVSRSARTHTHNPAKAMPPNQIKAKEDQKLPDYESPPVGEVVCGLFFERLPGFKSAHLGLLWTKFINDYPTVEDAAVLAPPGKEPTTEYVVVPPSPRVWFLHKDGNELIQVQPDWFLYNWRRRTEGDAYPHYRHVIQRFKTSLAVFKDFLAEHSLGAISPQQCMLTYINHIPQGEGWHSLEDISGIFVDLSQLPREKRFLPTPSNISWQREFVLPEDKGRLIVKLNVGKRRTDDKPVLVFELNALGLGHNKSEESVWEWFNTAHEWIVEGFADLTSQEIQRQLWRRKNV